MNDILSKYQFKPVEEYPNKLSENPLVSVCVITYQHAKYIAKCIDGILMQKTSFPFEILIGDDESTDGTREICIEYAKRYPNKIRLFLHSRKNVILIDGKPSGRFNYFWNLVHARGRYIAVCDGDDYWLNPHKLEKQVNFLENRSHISLCFTNFSIVNEEGQYVKNNGVPDNHKKDNFDYLRILEYYTPKVLTVLFRKEALPEKFPKEVFEVRNADVFIFSLIVKKSSASYLDINSGCYRLNQKSMWSMQTKLFQTEITLVTFFKMKEYFNTREELKAINTRISRNKIIQATIYFKKWNIIKGLNLLRDSLRYSFKPYFNIIHTIFNDII